MNKPSITGVSGECHKRLEAKHLWNSLIHRPRRSDVLSHQQFKYSLGDLVICGPFEWKVIEREYRLHRNRECPAYRLVWVRNLRTIAGGKSSVGRGSHAWVWEDKLRQSV